MIKIHLKSNPWGWARIGFWIRTTWCMPFITHRCPDRTYIHLWPFVVSVPRRWLPANGDAVKECLVCGSLEWMPRDRTIPTCDACMADYRRMVDEHGYQKAWENRTAAIRNAQMRKMAICR